MIFIGLFLVLWLSIELLCWILMRPSHRSEACKLIFAEPHRRVDAYLSPAKAHPILNFIPSSSIAGVNSMGYRSAGPTAGFQGIRLYLAGDCTFFDLELTPQASIGYLLQQEFSNRGSYVEVINAAFPYYSSVHSTTRFMIDILRFNCNIAILATGINDVEAFLNTGGIVEPDYSNYYRVVQKPPLVGNLMRRLPKLIAGLPSARLCVYSKIWRHVRPNWFHWNAIVQRDPRYIGQHLNTCYEQFHTRTVKTMLTTFVALCRTHGVTPVLATNYYQRSDMFSPERKFIKYGIDEVNEEIRRTSAEQHVLLLDLDSELRRVSAPVQNKWHYTAAANRMRVRFIVDELKMHRTTSPYFANDCADRQLEVTKGGTAR